jgi:hypothetical protein
MTAESGIEGSAAIGGESTIVIYKKRGRINAQGGAIPGKCDFNFVTKSGGEAAPGQGNTGVLIAG